MNIVLQKIIEQQIINLGGQCSVEPIIVQVSHGEKIKLGNDVYILNMNPELLTDCGVPTCGGYITLISDNNTYSFNKDSLLLLENYNNQVFTGQIEVKVTDQPYGQGAILHTNFKIELIKLQPIVLSRKQVIPVREEIVKPLKKTIKDLPSGKKSLQKERK